MKHLEDLLYRIQDDPVTYALRVVCLLGVGLLVGLTVGCATIKEANVVRSYSTDAGDVLVLSDDPCVTLKGVFAQVPIDQRKSELKAAKITWQGKAYDACWFKQDGVTMVIDETGDSGVIEGSPFDPKRGKPA